MKKKEIIHPLPLHCTSSLSLSSSISLYPTGRAEIVRSGQDSWISFHLLHLCRMMLLLRLVAA